MAAAFRVGARSARRATGRLCVAVDDLQWLDAASTAALRFALVTPRRAAARVLLTVRGDPPTWLRRGPARAGLVTVEVGGLSVGALARAPPTPPRGDVPTADADQAVGDLGRQPVLRARARHARSSDAAPPLAPGDPLPLPSTLDELLRERLDGLGPAAIEVAHGRRRRRRSDHGAGRGRCPRLPTSGLVEALDAGVLELDGERLRFTHPLLGTAVASRADRPARRRALHARLADARSDGRRSALVTSLSSTARPDARDRRDSRGGGAVGAARVAPRRRRRARRASASAHTAPESSGRGEAPSVPRGRPLLRRWGRRAGDRLARAGREQAAARGKDRAAVLAQLARVSETPRRGVAVPRGASDAVTTMHSRPRSTSTSAALMRFSEGSSAGSSMANLPSPPAARVGDAALRCRALAAYGLLHFNAGRGIPHAQMDEALQLERSLDDWPLEDGPTIRLRSPARVVSEVDRARTLLQEFRRRDAAIGTTHWANPTALWYLGLARVAGGELGGVRSLQRSRDWSSTTQLGRDHRPPTSSPCHHRPHTAAGSTTRAPTGRDRRRQRRGAEGHARRRVGLQLGARASSSSPSAIQWRRSRTSDARTRDSRRLHPRAGDAVGARRSARGARRDRCARRGGRCSSPVKSLERPALDRAWALAILARGRGLLLAARGELPTARSRASSRRSPSTPGRTRPVPPRADAPRTRPNATTREEARRRAHDARGRARALRDGSARRSGPSRRARSWRGSAAAPPRTAR